LPPARLAPPRALVTAPPVLELPTPDCVKALPDVLPVRVLLLNCAEAGWVKTPPARIVATRLASFVDDCMADFLSAW
jgi:hypothetical protein